MSTYETMNISIDFYALLIALAMIFEQEFRWDKTIDHFLAYKRTIFAKSNLIMWFFGGKFVNSITAEWFGFFDFSTVSSESLNCHNFPPDHQKMKVVLCSASKTVQQLLCRAISEIRFSFILKIASIPNEMRIFHSTPKITDIQIHNNAYNWTISISYCNKELS